MNHGVLEQIPRSALVLMFAAQAAVIAPQVTRLPVWILAVWALCVVWRVLVYQGRWGWPGNAVKGGLIALAAVGIGIGHETLYGLDPASSLLVVAFSLKLLETRARRDALVVIYLAYFVLAVEFLYAQSMALTAYQLGATVLVTAALVGLHQSWSRPRTLDSLRTAAVLMLQAVPLTVVMFVFFPRVAPLWSVPLPTEGTRSGVSDSMSPGDVARLGLSEDLAFRVEFDGEVPANPQLYWRVLTLSRYEDGTWSSGRIRDTEPDNRLVWFPGAAPPAWLRRLEREGAPIDYSVVAEPTYRPWLPALDLADPRTRSIGLAADFRILLREPLVTRMRYSMRAWPETTLDARLDARMRLRDTELPAQGDPRTRALATRLAAEAGSDAEFITRVLGRFRTEPYVYTLQPPTLQGDRIDAFLFETRRGFCAHYAGAFVYMMRVAGIPARVVAGYQGGEPNPLGDHLVVRQYDAHAWAEVWLEGQGWVRIDPTAAVAPNRIERGADAALREAAGADLTFATQGLRSFDWAADLLFWIDSMEYRWNVFVLSYDATLQSRFLRDLLGELTPARVAVAVTLAGALAIGLASLGALGIALRGRRPRLLRAHDAFAAAGAAAGTPRAPHETPAAYGRRLARAHPAAAEDALGLGAALDAALFAPDADVDPALLRARVRRLRRRLALIRLRGTFGGAPRDPA